MRKYFRRSDSSCCCSGVRAEKTHMGKHYSPPREEGWLRHQEKCRAATEADTAGVVFLLHPSENHPGLAISGASRYLLDRSATPPCGDARRGLGPATPQLSGRWLSPWGEGNSLR